MKTYLAGYIYRGKDNEIMEKCLAWRRRIINFYADYKGLKYPIDFLCPLNSGELESIDEKGLSSNIPFQMIVHKDYMAVNNADIVIANLDTFGQERWPVGTISEIAWAWQMHKPIIIISSDETYKNHPFLKYFASTFVDSVEELLEKKLLNVFYKSINSAIY